MLCNERLRTFKLKIFFMFSQLTLKVVEIGFLSVPKLKQESLL